MKKEVVLQVAREKMLSLYGESLPIEILSRFYSEKAMLEGCEFYLMYLDLLGKLRERANERGRYKQAGGMDEETRVALLALGFDMDFTFLLEEIVYLFPKAQAIAYLKEATAMTWYRCRYPEQYAEIFGSETR